jgi:alpha-D-ribose 1-methylphosphonate 5-triphosphate synthase subunit PhnI
MYVAVKGGEKAIENSHTLLAETRRGDRSVPQLSVRQIQEQLSLSVARVMTEGSLYDPELAALAIKQAQGDLVEAIFLLRAYRTTLQRFGNSEPIDTNGMRIERRISATFKDLPGGQILGPTYDYTHRLLDFSLLNEDQEQQNASIADQPLAEQLPRVAEILGAQGLLEPASHAGTDSAEPFDLTREPMSFPADRDQRLQNLFRGDEGFILALGYSTQRGFGGVHPFAGEIRFGQVEVSFVPEELGFPVSLGEITVTESEMVTQFQGAKDVPPQFTRGYGISFGHSERKAMAMALVDRAMRCEEFEEEAKYPAQSQEFVMYHSDNVEASGFVQHLKLPHYVDFQSELELLRRLRREMQSDQRESSE